MISTLLALTLLASSDVMAGPDLSAPAAARFGQSVEAHRAIMETACATYSVRNLDPAELPIAQTSHIQIDCQGLDHAGRSRLAEFVFADDALAFVWVLTDASEETGLLTRLQDAHGEPSHSTPMFFAFADHNMALRRDIPELLYYGDAIAPVYRAWFDQMAAQ